MVHALARNWWALTIRGVAAIIFGILAIVWPGAAIVAIGILFGAYAFIDGIFAIVAAVRAAESHERWWPFLIEGIIGLVIAAIAFYDVEVLIAALFFTIAVWAFLTGVMEIVAAIQLRKVIENEAWLIIGGVLSILFAVLMVWHPIAGAVAVVWIIGIYAIVFGIMMIGLSLRLKSHVTGVNAPAV